MHTGRNAPIAALFARKNCLVKVNRLKKKPKECDMFLGFFLLYSFLPGFAHSPDVFFMVLVYCRRTTWANQEAWKKHDSIERINYPILEILDKVPFVVR